MSCVMCNVSGGIRQDEQKGHFWRARGSAGAGGQVQGQEGVGGPGEGAEAEAGAEDGHYRDGADDACGGRGLPTKGDMKNAL